MSPSNRELVDRSLSGDGDAFGDLVERYTPAVRAAVLQEIRDQDAVEDLVQEAFCQAYRRLGQLRSPARIAGWLCEIAHHAAVRWRWREHKRNTVEDVGGQVVVAAPRFTPPDDEVAQRQERDLLWAQVDQLEPSARQLILLRYVESCSYRQIAHFLDVPIATVYLRMGKAERQLGRLLAQELTGSTGRDEAQQRARNMRRAVLAALPLAWDQAADAQVAASWWLRLSPRTRIVGTCLVASGVVHLGSLLWRAADGDGGVLVSAPESTPIPVASFDAQAVEPEGQVPLRVATAPGIPKGIEPLPQLPLPDQLEDGSRIASDGGRMPLASAALMDRSARRVESITLAETEVEDSEVPVGDAAIELMSIRLTSHGSGSDTGNFLADLAEFLRRECHLAFRVAGGSTKGFLHPRVLETPIHFILQGGGEQISDGRTVLALAPGEAQMLGTYMRRGGLLYIEGDQGYLAEMVQVLSGQVADDSRLRELSPRHALYGSWFRFPSGFPGENKLNEPVESGGDWYFPAQPNARTWGDPLGLWAVESKTGRLLAVLSDLPLFRGWQDIAPPDPDEEEPAGLLSHRPALMAATNLVTFAMRQPR